MFFTPGGLTRFFPSTRAGRLGAAQPRRPAGELGRQEQPAADPGGVRAGADPQDDAHPAPVAAQRASRRSSSGSPSTSRPPPAHQFRHPDDISLLSSLQQYYAYLTGRAAPGEIRYMYTDLADPATPFKLARLLRDRHLDAFCLNDTDSDAVRRRPSRPPCSPTSCRRTCRSPRRSSWPSRGPAPHRSRCRTSRSPAALRRRDRVRDQERARLARPSYQGELP